MKRTTATLLLAVMSSAPVMAADCYDGKTDDCTATWSNAHKPKTAMAGKCDPNSVILNGIFSRGSAMCNQAWLDRPASLRVLALARDCRALGDKEKIAYLKRGVLDFDHRVKEMGHTAACEDLDANMKTMEH